MTTIVKRIRAKTKDNKYVYYCSVCLEEIKEDEEYCPKCPVKFSGTYEQDTNVFNF